MHFHAIGVPLIAVLTHTNKHKIQFDIYIGMYVCICILIGLCMSIEVFFGMLIISPVNIVSRTGNL